MLTLNEARYVWGHRHEYPREMVDMAMAVLEHAGEL